ncbi:hypothetical protein [Amycolatopsis regifaucium]|uniref:Lipoprotein n=1 Tax=Amycolatopsis regifaucium TaxID=546365 RepID=A0A154MPQ0_9PSEU|nr:hypothetical protein [Amycolatopsis regifaucium]KZB86274.1 hypothetical protein AVL48_29390 [Amycolatopsis regifaucium]OKA05166.1 hypothetical protein ATP06_0229485 [Amycolatopsis regifaucium]SFH84332.1 hypothetical protein SAMN04489731_106453 [Amycolatopsis regifaucium]
MSVNSDQRGTAAAARRGPRRAAMVAVTALGLSTAATLGPIAATANAAPCGVSAYSAGVTVDTETNAPDFRISIAPTDNARWAQVSGHGHEATVHLWHDVQGCIPCLYHGLADSIYQQIECHVIFGRIDPATGSTFDLESWHAPLATPDVANYVETGCLNNVTGGWKGTGRNLPGGLDQPANSTTA